MLQQPTFGRRLRKLRTDRGLSQTALAGDGMSTGYLSRLESGDRQPTARAVGYLASRLGLDPADFEEPDGGSLADVLSLAASSGAGDTTGALTAALAAEGDSAPAPLRWQARWVLAEQCRLQGDNEGEREHLEQLVRLGDEVGLPALRVRGLTRLARCLRSLGEIAAALDAATAADRIARANAAVPVDDRITVLLALVSVKAEASRIPEAAADAEELVALVEGRTDALWAEAMWTAAAVRMRQGDHAAAEQCLGQALAGFGSRTDLVLWLRLRLAAGQLHLHKTPADPEAAERCIAAAESALALVGTARLRQELTSLKAELAFAVHRYDEARELLGELAVEESRMTYRGRMRLEIMRHRLRILSGDESGVQGLHELAAQARADANIDVAADIWRVLAETLTQSRRDAAPA